MASVVKPWQRSDLVLHGMSSQPCRHGREEEAVAKIRLPRHYALEETKKLWKEYLGQDPTEESRGSRWHFGWRDREGFTHTCYYRIIVETEPTGAYTTEIRPEYCGHVENSVRDKLQAIIDTLWLKGKELDDKE